MESYRVFGRKSYRDPLSEQGEIELVNLDDAKKRAVERFGGEWVELILIPESAFHWVVRRDNKGRDTARVRLEVKMRNEQGGGGGNR